MTFHHLVRHSRKAGLMPPPARVRRHHPDFDRLATQGWKAAGCRGPAVRGGLAQGAEMGARHGAARRREPDRPDHPDLRARRAAAFRRHQHVPEGAVCRERARRGEIRRRGDRHPVRFRHHLSARHALRAAGHPPHLGAVHAVQLRARRRSARADDAVRRRRRVHHPGQSGKELRPDHAAAWRTSPRPARCRSCWAAITRSAFPACAASRNARRSASASSISTATSTSRRRTSTSACTPRRGTGRPTCRTCRRPIWCSSASAAGRCRAPACRRRGERNTNVLTIEDIEKLGLEKTAEIALELAWKDADAVYISFDVDSVDCGFVPGTGWPEPGGFLPREALKLLGLVAARGRVRAGGGRGLAALRHVRHHRAGRRARGGRGAGRDGGARHARQAQASDRQTGDLLR